MSTISTATTVINATIVGVGVPVGLMLLRCNNMTFVWDINDQAVANARNCLQIQVTQQVLAVQAVNQASNKALEVPTAPADSAPVKDPSSFFDKLTGMMGGEDPTATDAGVTIKAEDLRTKAPSPASTTKAPVVAPHISDDKGKPSQPPTAAKVTSTSGAPRAIAGGIWSVLTTLVVVVAAGLYYI